MRNLIFALLVSSLVIGCSSTDKTAENNLLLVEKYVKGVENMDYDIMEELLADNYIGLGPSFGDSTNKVQAIENWKQNVENLYEKIEYQKSRNAAVTITTGDNQGEWVSNWAELKITYKNDKGSVIIWANSTYLIENGEIIKSYTFYNEADALRQLGYVFINPDHL